MLCDGSRKAVRHGIMKAPWGKYRGISLEFINSGYLRFLVKQDFMLKKENEDFLLAIENEIRLRDMDNSHFYEDKVSL